MHHFPVIKQQMKQQQQQAPFGAGWHAGQEPPPSMPPGVPPGLPPGVPPPQIQQMQEQISQSEQNLAAQYSTMMQQQQVSHPVISIFFFLSKKCKFLYFTVEKSFSVYYSQHSITSHFDYPPF